MLRLAYPPGDPPGGTTSISLIPQAHVVVDSRQSGAAEPIVTPDTPQWTNRQSGPPSHRHPGRWDSMPETSGARRDGHAVVGRHSGPSSGLISQAQ
jgi:hypothetical protein